MKKLIYILIAVLLITIPLSTFAAKQIELTEIQDLMGRIFFNQKISDTEYAPIAIQFIGKAKGDGITLNVQEVIMIGGIQPNPHTPKELYQLLVTKFGQGVADKIKNIYINGINEDISQ